LSWWLQRFPLNWKQMLWPEPVSETQLGGKSVPLPLPLPFLEGWLLPPFKGRFTGPSLLTPSLLPAAEGPHEHCLAKARDGNWSQ
jgi:hypothetical protein